MLGYNSQPFDHHRRRFLQFKGKSAAAVGPMPESMHDNANAEKARVTFNEVNSDITTTSHVSSYDKQTKVCKGMPFFV